MTVGRSSRTPFKNFLLNLLLGKVVGVMSLKKRFPSPPLYCVDLCAGDGRSSEYGRSSPEIFHKHCQGLAKKGVPVEAVFIEKASNTFAALEESFHQWGDPSYERVILNEDSSAWRCPAVGKTQGVFINCDPNNIANMPFCDGLASSLTEATTILMTMGCNPSGIKRLPLSERILWYDYVERVIRGMPHYHDAILIAINNDSSQWAYLCRLPVKWSLSIIKRIQKQGDIEFDSGVTVASLSEESSLFRDLLDKLFLTQKELSIYESEKNP